MNAEAIKHVWILAYPRCGSHYLAERLNQAQPNRHAAGIQEWYRPPHPLPEAPPLSCLVHPHQYRWAHLELSELARPSGRANVQFVLLRRRDLFAVTVSRLIAKRTNVWWITSHQQLETWRATSIGHITAQELRAAHKTTIRQDRFWSAECMRAEVEPLRVWYEDIVEESGCFEWLCLALGLTVPPSGRTGVSAIPILRQQRKESQRLRQRLARLWNRGQA